MPAAAPLVDDATRREFVLGTGALLALLAGCGAGPEEGPASSAGYPRTVTDASGADVVLPQRPRRIVCGQNTWDLDAVLALGEEPVQFGLRDFATYTGSTTTSWPWHEQALAAADPPPERLPVTDTLNIEAIARSAPDLIVGDDAVVEPRAQLEQLAPVLQIANFDWRRNLRMLGAALDLADDAEALIAETDQRLSTALSGYDIAGARVAMFAVYDAATFYVFGDPSIPAVDLVTRAGFGLLDDVVAAATPDEPRVEYSAERLGLLEAADVVVVFNYGDGGQAAPITTEPLFTRLPAVQAGRVIVIPQGERAQGLSVFGPLNLQLGLDLVREAADLLAS